MFALVRAVRSFLRSSDSLVRQASPDLNTSHQFDEIIRDVNRKTIARALNRFYIVLSFALFVGLLLWAPERMVQWTISGPQKANEHLTPNEYAKLVDDYRKTVAQILIGLGALGTLYFSWQRSMVERETLLISQRTLETTRDSTITERFAKAVEQLGATDKDGKKLLEVRFGGIYALERVSKDSLADSATVMEILAAYIRENSELPANNDGPVRRDIQAILTVLGRRNQTNKDAAPVEIDLRSTNLQRANLEYGDFRKANLYAANLRHSWLRGTNLAFAFLEKANLQNANLDHSILDSAFLSDTDFERAQLRVAKLSMALLVKANLQNSDLRHAMLSRTNLKDANLVNANISDARFEDTYLKGADLSGVIGLTREMLDAALLDHCTKLPPEFEHLIPQPGADKKSIWDGPPVDIP